ncbi:MAG: glycosyltransferase family 4 protein [Sulfitobacter sp.]
MHIAYILNTYPQPSHSFIRREIRALEAQGHRVTRMAMRAPSGALPDAQDREEQDKTHYVLPQGPAALLRALAGQLRRDPSRWLAALRRAWQMGARAEVGRLKHLIYFAESCYAAQYLETADAEHTHAHFGTNAAAVAHLAHALGAPRYSFTVHGPEEFDSPRALALDTKMADAAFTVAISQFGRSQLCRWSDAASWDRIKVVHCGIEPARFASPAPLPPRAPDTPLRVVSIGRFVEQKGQLALIDALALAPNIHLTLIGDGDMRPQIEAAIAAHNLTARVTLTGMVDEARVRAELDDAHALIMPSFAEGLPMVVMEAMAAARPVIATYIAGTPELVLPGQTGWLVPAGDPAALAAALQVAAQTPVPDLQKMGDTARARVFERHNVATEAAKLARHIQKSRP